MALVARTFNWLPNPDGTVDGHNPLGDKAPHVSALAWGDLSAFIATIQQTATGSSVSANARAALTGTNAATATITWETVSGSDVTATGFTVSGSNVLISSATAGSGFGRLGANDGTGIVYSAPIQWTRIAAPTDVLAPTTPTGLLGTPITGGVTWTWDPASDPHDGTHAGSGVKEYDLELNGSITVVPGLPGIVSAPTVSNIGTISNPGAPTAVQAGRNWTLTAAGTGIDGTSDQFLFLNWAVSGDCRAVAKINSVGGAGSTFAVAGLMMRESLAVDAKYVALDQFRSAQSQAVQGKQRITTAGARSNLSTGAGTNTPRWVKIERAGNIFTLSYSLDGMAWVALDSTTVPMTASIYIGAFATSLSAGNEVIGAVNDLNVSSTPQATYTQTTPSATVARVRARDLQSTPNVGSYCALSPSVSPLAAASIKFNPGPYVFESNFDTYNPTRLNEILAMANVKGYKIRVRWRTIETSRGVYSFTFLDTLLSIVRTAGKQLIIEVISNSFDGNNPIPAYLATETNAAGGWYVKTTPLAGYQPKVYLAPVMNRILALAQAIGNKYDSDPNVGCVSFLPESSLPQAPADYSDSGYRAQFLVFAATVASYYPHTTVLLGANFGFGSNKQYWADIYAGLKAGRVGTNNPDVYINSDDNSSYADKTSRGLIWNGTAWVAGGIDYRGVIPISHDVQAPELGGKENTGGGQTIPTLMTQATTVNKDNYVCFLYKDYEIAPTPPNDIYWSNAGQTNIVSGAQDIKTYLNSGVLALVTTLPSVYTGLALIFSEDFKTGYTWGTLPVTSAATARTQMGANWQNIDWSSGHGSIAAWTPDNSLNCYQIGYVNSDDADIIQHNFLTHSNPGRPKEAWFQWLEYRPSTFDFGPSKDFRFMIYQINNGQGGSDPLVDVYGGFTGPAFTGSQRNCQTAGINIQGLGVAQPGGDANTIVAASYVFTRATAHKVEVHIKLNTPGNFDGAADLWVDTVHVLTKTGVKYTPDSWTQGYIDCFRLGMAATNGGHAFIGTSTIQRTSVKVSAGYIG